MENQRMVENNQVMGEEVNGGADGEDGKVLKN